MRLGILAVLATALWLASAAGAGEADEKRLPTPTELRQMRDAGHYRICLQQIARALRLADAGKDYDHYDLLLLRGDCLLHLNDPATAQLAYAAAAKSPVAEQAREGRATVLLLRLSTKLRYVPQGGGDAGEGIDLTTREGRISALRALLKDELRANEADFRRLTITDDIALIREALPKLADLYAVERTATGGDTTLRPILEAIARRARTLIERELDLNEQSVAVIAGKAGTAVGSAGDRWWWGRSARRGLYTSDRRKLRDLIDYVQRVEDTARLGQQVAASFDGDATVWDPLITRASKAVRYAQDVLDAE
jgi:hypothetical protein